MPNIDAFPRCRVRAPWPLTLLLLAVCSHPAAAMNDDDPDITFAADISHFDYREFDRDGHELNHESGPLPGLRLTADAGKGQVFARLGASVHSGTVDYDGETQAGNPVTTRTDTRLVTLAVEAGRWFGEPGHGWAGFLRLARRMWDRDIRSSRRARGLYEEYRWSEAGVGVRRVWPSSTRSRWRHSASATLLTTFDGTVYVRLTDVDPSWDNDVLDLGDEPGVRVRYTATRDFGEQTWRIEPYFEYWEFGRSDTHDVTANGADTGYNVSEPRSESWRLGVAVGLVF